MEEITAEFSADTLAPSVELRVVPKITIACKTDVGRVREINQDKFEYYLPGWCCWSAMGWGGMRQVRLRRNSR